MGIVTRVVVSDGNRLTAIVPSIVPAKVVYGNAPNEGGVGTPALCTERTAASREKTVMDERESVQDESSSCTVQACPSDSVS